MQAMEHLYDVYIKYHRYEMLWTQLGYVLQNL